MQNFNKNKRFIKENLGIKEADLLGKGVESVVYKYRKDKVVRILKDTNIGYLDSLKKLQESINNSGLSVKTPQIINIGVYKETVYSIEKRFEGENLSKIIDSFTDQQKGLAVLNYFNVLPEFSKVKVNNYKFGQLLNTKDKISEDEWSEFLNKKVRQKTDLVKNQLIKDVANFEKKLGVFEKIASTKLTNIDKNLVHGDYFYDNVMVNNKQEITGVLDFSGWTTVVGDFRLDVAGSIIFLEHSEKFIKYQKELTEIAKERSGEDIEWFIDFYRIYYCLFLSDSYLYLKPLYKWCVKNLNDKYIWNKM